MRENRKCRWNRKPQDSRGTRFPERRFPVTRMKIKGSDGFWLALFPLGLVAINWIHSPQQIDDLPCLILGFMVIPMLFKHGRRWIRYAGNVVILFIWGAALCATGAKILSVTFNTYGIIVESLPAGLFRKLLGLLSPTIVIFLIPVLFGRHSAASSAALILALVSAVHGLLLVASTGAGSHSISRASYPSFD